MIGKFLENEEKNSAAKTESNNFQTEEPANPAADVFSLPKSQEPDFPNFEAEPYTENNQAEAKTRPETSAINSENDAIAPPVAPVSQTVQTETKSEPLPSETAAENLRKTGLAWSAATVLGGSVIFMMIIGWFFDLVFGSKPWGIVGGIVIGAIVGFIQFFRITSQIFKNESSSSTGILDHKD